MLKKNSLKPVSAIMGTAFVVSLTASPILSAAENPFGVTELSSGYMVADAGGNHGEGMDKKMEGKCGEGMDKKMEGKCGEGMDKKMEGKCSEGMDKKMEGKCGEGKCGANK